MDSISIVASLLLEASNNLPHRDYAKLDALLRRAKMIIAKAFGVSSFYLGDLEAIRFLPRDLPPRTGLGRYYSSVAEEKMAEEKYDEPRRAVAA